MAINLDAILVKGIISYPHLLTAVGNKEYPNSPHKYSTNVMIKKGDPQLQMIEQRMLLKAPMHWNGVINPQGKIALKDGATTKSLMSDPQHHDYMFLSMSRKLKDGPCPVIGPDRKPWGPEEFHLMQAGQIGRAHV